MTPGWVSVAIALIPLLTALGVGLLPRARADLAHGIAAAAMAACTALCVWLAIDIVGSGQAVQGPHATWLQLGSDGGSFTLGIGTYVDPMGAVMALIVCGLATVVLVFNAWYMHGDALAARFPWQFCFFVFAMLGVVLSDNLFLSFVCWELVGLGSYLLIGFWFDKPAASEDSEYQRLKGRFARGVLEDRLSPAHAQLKAFVMNRVGDAGFLLGMGALLAAAIARGDTGEVFSWQSLASLPGSMPAGEFLGASGQAWLTLAALGIFCGAIGKSAQFPLHPWLPDAMQGPTTASSIIHAATMVAAGVFLVARTYFLFTADALAVVGWTGGITCLLAASIACVQWDLKAVLAYSTVSQLGLMFVALGAGAQAGGQAAGIAHLFTHAFFKCLLFLCAGAVIHACTGCQDLSRLGGLRKRMPVTALASLLAVLAIAGAPLFSGFYSKDAVLAAALVHARAAGGLAWGPFALACAGSVLTAAYMLRWWLRIFWSEERNHEVTHHAHDPAPAAKGVLLVLLPFTLALPWTLGDWLDHALAAPHGEAVHAAHGAAMWIASALLLVGASFAVLVFAVLPARGVDAGAALAQRLRGLHVACAELWGIDRLWDRLFTRGLGVGLGKLTAHLDLGNSERLGSLEGSTPSRAAHLASLDGLIDGVGRACGRLGRSSSLAHAGRVGSYIGFTAVLGAVIMLVLLLR